MTWLTHQSVWIIARNMPVTWHCMAWLPFRSKHLIPNIYLPNYDCQAGSANQAVGIAWFDVRYPRSPFKGSTQISKNRFLRSLVHDLWLLSSVRCFLCIFYLLFTYLFCLTCCARTCSHSGKIVQLENSQRPRISITIDPFETNFNRNYFVQVLRFKVCQTCLRKRYLNYTIGS